MYRIGIIGTGRIAERMVSTGIGDMDVEVSAVYNPNINSARSFADRYQIDIATDDMDIFMDNIDVAYVASPHETHYNYCRTLLHNSIHVLCEKPMALNKNQAVELYDIALKNNLVLREAIKTAYCPGFNELINIVKGGKIGTVVDVEATFTRLTPFSGREFQAPKYNGSMLELGSYGLLPVFRLLGTEYIDVSFNSIRAQNGVDAYTKAYFTFLSGMATVKCGLGVKSEGELIISGTRGYIQVPSPWWMTKKFYVRYEDSSKVEEYQFEYEGSGLQYELAMFLVAIMGKKAGYIDEDIAAIKVSEAESIAMADVMERFLDWNRPIVKNVRKSLLAMKKSVGVWAHRGCSYAYPENTMSAFLAAARLNGLKGIELDVQFTKDRQIVVFHDENVGRVTTGVDNVCEYTLAELKMLKIPAGKDNNGAEIYEEIPTLRQVLEALKPYCISKGMLINIELKTSVIRYEGIEEATHKLVKELGMEEYIVYSSFLNESVEIMKKLAPECEAGVLAVTYEDCIDMLKVSGADAIHPSIDGVGYRLPKEYEGITVRAWNSSEPFYSYMNKEFKIKNLNEYSMYGVTDIFTNIPEEYIMMMDERCAACVKLR